MVKKIAQNARKKRKKLVVKTAKKIAKNVRKTLKLQLYKFVFINNRFQKSRFPISGFFIDNHYL
jgi:hypothetical protein